ncbi:MAG: GMC family oxidoreductase [Myxococcota bacterium]
MSGEILQGRDLRGEQRLDADVVIVGSGAGGAVVAAHLAEAGQDVIVLEEGPWVRPEEYARMRPSESLRTLWRDGGMTAALGRGGSPLVNVTMGRCVGGSSVLTGGVCFRIPGSVMDTWSREHGLSEFTPDRMEGVFQDVEQAVRVEEVPADMRSRGTEAFARGAREMGYEMKPLFRNTRDCGGAGQCNFGCPKGAKMSVDRSYLPRAIAAGTRVLSDCLVERVLTKGDRAVGVEGRLYNRGGKRKGDRVTVRARRVVVSAGAWHSPLLLKRSGVGRRSRQVGRNLTLHPAFRVTARFDDPIRGWDGALQSAWSDAWEHEKITLVGLFIPPSVIAATLPGFGPEHARRAEQMPHMAMMGGLIHDEGGGVIRRGPGREPFVTYRMSRGDRAAIPRVMRIMAETFLAAGAREVYLPILGHEPVDADGLSRMDLEKVPPGRIECASQHPLGSCRMGTSPERSVVDPDGQAWDLRDLYVVDGSVTPTSLGVNPQLSIMSIATHLAWKMRERPLPG